MIQIRRRMKYKVWLSSITKYNAISQSEFNQTEFKPSQSSPASLLLFWNICVDILNHWYYVLILVPQSFTNIIKLRFCHHHYLTLNGPSFSAHWSIVISIIWHFIAKFVTGNLSLGRSETGHYKTPRARSFRLIEDEEGDESLPLTDNIHSSSSLGACLHQVSASMLQQLCDDVSDSVLVENNGVTPEWGCVITELSQHWCWCLV